MPLTVTKGQRTHLSAFWVWVTALWRDSCLADCASKGHSVQGKVCLRETAERGVFDMVVASLCLDEGARAQEHTRLHCLLPAGFNDVGR